MKDSAPILYTHLSSFYIVINYLTIIWEKCKMVAAQMKEDERLAMVIIDRPTAPRKNTIIANLGPRKTPDTKTCRRERLAGMPGSVRTQIQTERKKDCQEH